MTSTKYIGMDVHKESISIADGKSAGKVVMECVIETKASMILQFIDGRRGDRYVTFEEGTWAASLFDLLKPQVTKVVVCDPRLNALLQEGNQNDSVDAGQAGRTAAAAPQPTALGLSRRPGLRTLKEPVRSKSDHHPRSQPGPVRLHGQVKLHSVAGSRPEAREVHRDFKNSMTAFWSGRFSFS